MGRRLSELMEKCTELRDYAILISRIRSNCQNGMVLGDAIDKAIDDCIKEGIMKEILEAHRMEAKEMLFTEYNEEAHINHVKESSYEQGREEERDQAILIFIEDKLEDNISVEIIENKLNKRYDLSSDKAKEYIERASAIMKEKK
ncbi:hypothetical protein [Butyrivibrio sp. TB]|nr:hypothetical protein [Butyrivibrio sp. TB]